MDEKRIKQVKLKYGIVGNAPALLRAIDIALRIAPVDLSVLITGENGVGKENFPRIIHDNSLRKTKKYFAVNCGAIPEGTIDSELFGHEKGAFTGAIDKREGYFSVADGGTLFLDEVGELPLATQARLLRVLETGEFIPVGASQVKKTNVRIVAATNVDMQEAIRRGKFREDLYYRLGGITIGVPPLRERGDDIVLLFRKFALDMAERYKMPAVRLTDEAQQQLKAYPWPGNVRQLKNVAETLSVTSDEREISAETLREFLPVTTRNTHTQMIAKGTAAPDGSRYEQEREIIFKILFALQRDVEQLKEALRATGVDPATMARALPAPTATTAVSPTLADAKHTFSDADVAEAEEIKDTTAPTIEEVTEELIREALRRHAGHRRAAAEELGISERTLYRKINEYGIE
ncbi:MAG: sigma-54-dependent Fis family transcriptional regulator [Bacteroidaceae bacterium]|nr:sigma-54-dependent Fis family transcriptional regulator [Bacteroidaceae bacterium]